MDARSRRDGSCASERVDVALDKTLEAGTVAAFRELGNADK
jgi:hypothetical protein